MCLEHQIKKEKKVYRRAKAAHIIAHKKDKGKIKERKVKIQILPMIQYHQRKRNSERV